MLGPATKNDLSPYVDVACCTWSILVSADLILERQLSVCRQMSARYVEARPFEHLWTSVASLNVTRTAIPDTCNLSYPSASAVVIHYEEVLYQVYVLYGTQYLYKMTTTGARQPVRDQCMSGAAGAKHTCVHMSTAACLLIEMWRCFSYLLNFCIFWLELRTAVGLGLVFGYVRLALTATKWLVSILRTQWARV